MKKLAIFALVIGAMSLASCKKNYSCDCTSSGGVKTSYKLGKTAAALQGAACTGTGCVWAQN